MLAKESLQGIEVSGRAVSHIPVISFLYSRSIADLPCFDDDRWTYIILFLEKSI